MLGDYAYNAPATGSNEFLTFTPIAKFRLAFNHQPIVDDASHGFWRRVRLIPFLHRFEETAIHKTLPKKLRAEARHSRMGRPCPKWQQHGSA